MNMFFNKENKLEPKSNFFSKIEEYYNDLSKKIIPNKLNEQIINLITNHQYNHYYNSWHKYPKSKKRFSIFITKDLENPSVYFLIISFLEEKEIEPDNFKRYCKILFKMNDEEFYKIKDYKYWYDTK